MYTVYDDKKITCVDCGKEFVFTAGEQKFYHMLVVDGKMASYSEPKRCNICRAEKKKKYNNLK